MSSSDEEHNKKKKSSKEDKKDAAHAAALLEGRKEDFYNSLIPFVDRYGRDMIRAFYDYWTEPNKSRTRMRFELERTWDVSRRLVTWASRDKQFNSNDTVRVNASEQRNADAAKNIASFLADD